MPDIPWPTTLSRWCIVPLYRVEQWPTDCGGATCSKVQVVVLVVLYCGRASVGALRASTEGTVSIEGTVSTSLLGSTDR